MKKILFSLVIGLTTFGNLCGSQSSPEDYSSQVLKLFDQGRSADVAYLSKARIEQNPTDCEAYKYLAQASPTEETLAYLEQLGKGSPDNHCIRYGLGWTYHALRQYEKAQNSYERSTDLAKKANDPRWEAAAKIGLATLCLHYGNPDKAFMYLSEVPNLSKKSPDYAEALLRMAEALLDLGELSEAREKCLEVVKIREELNSRALWNAYNLLGDVHLASGDRAVDRDSAHDEYRKAVEHYTKALHATRSPSHQQSLLVSLADAYLRDGEPYTALAYYASFLQGAPQQDPSLKEDHSKAIAGVGEIHLKRGHYDQAIEYLHQAVRLAVADKNKRLEMSWIKRLGDVYAAKGDYDKAREYYDRVLQTVKDGFLELGPEPKEERYVFFAGEFEAYEAMVDLLLKMNEQNPEKEYAKEAFEYMERARAQSMLQVLFQNRIVEKLLQAPAKNELQERLARLQGEVNAKHQIKLEKLAAMRDQNPYAVENLNHEIKALDVEIESLYKRMVSLIKQKFRDSDLSGVVEKVQKETLKSTEALIEYMVTEEKTFIFLVTQNELRYTTVPIGRRGYAADQSGRAGVRSIRRLMRKVSPLFLLPNEVPPKRPRAINPRTAEIQLRELHELYENIFQPIEKDLPPASQLIIVPDDVLYYLPFEMLVTKFGPRSAPEYLLSRYPISYSYSARLLVNLSTMPLDRPELSLLIANPDFGAAARAHDHESSRVFGEDGRLSQLPHAEEEINRVSKMIRNSAMLVRAQATEAAFKRRAAEAGIIHIATHSFFNRRSYLDSQIIFALDENINKREGEDGILYLHEIMNLRLKALLIVLTGCETGLGHLRRGGGLEGLSRAFLSAGVPSVIGTLWPIADGEATPTLVAGFYKYLSQGMGKREALQKAKLELMAERRYTDPFHWAPLILIGDTRAVPLAQNQWSLTGILVVVLLSLLLLFYFSLNGKSRKVKS